MLPLEIVTEPSRLILTRHRPINGGGKRIGNELHLYLILSLLTWGGTVLFMHSLLLCVSELSVLYLRAVAMSQETIVLSVWLTGKRG